MAAKLSYTDQLKHPKWQRRRLEIMQRADFHCESCKSGEITLNVHHKLYRKGAMAWEYADNELQCLCENCHKGRHDVIAEIEALLHELPTESLFQVRTYAGAIAVALGRLKSIPLTDSDELRQHGMFLGVMGAFFIPQWQSAADEVLRSAVRFSRAEMAAILRRAGDIP